MPKTPEQLARKRERKAEKARRRRALKGATPRTESRAAQLRDQGVSPDAFYARERRSRIRDSVSYPSDSVLYPLATETVSEGDGSSYPRDSDPYPCDGVSYPPEPTAEPIKLYSDLWGGWVPVPPIRAAVSAEPSIDASPGRADRLIAAVAGLPGGADPAFQQVLRRLVEAAEARELAR